MTDTSAETLPITAKHFVIRRRDGAIFDPALGDPDSRLVLFRRVAWKPYRWWFGGRLVRTGEIWFQPSGFTTISRREAKQLARQQHGVWTRYRGLGVPRYRDGVTPSHTVDEVRAAITDPADSMKR